ncbi:chemotaxis protein CheC [Halobacteriaceae archaeon GCM10025711]
MKLNVETLGTFYELARDGAELAARRLAPVTDLDTRVAVTRLHFTSRSGIVDELDDGTEKVAVRVELTGGLEGTSLIVFDREDALAVAETLVAEFPQEERGQISRSAIVEVSQMMLSGFVDEWSDTLDVHIDITAPTFVTGTDPVPFVDGPDADDVEHAADELVLVFRSRLTAIGTEIAFKHYLIPDQERMGELLEAHTGDSTGIEHEKLYRFDRMAQEGAREAAANLTTMTDLEVAVDIRRINFVSLDAIPRGVPNAPQISVAFSFTGTPSGYLLFLFDEHSADELMTAAMGGIDEDDPGDAIRRDAISELSNIMASGMLDGWANLLDTTINHSTPAYVHDMGAAVVDPLIVGLGYDQSFAFVFDTRIRGVDTAFDVQIYIIPDEQDLQAALRRLDADAADVPTTAELSFGEFEATEVDPSQFSDVAESDSP